jgi:UDP-N-acetylglucosamine 4,6-dehydratase/5-epimerase
MFNDSSILITGGTGSFGKAFVRRIADKYKPRRLIVFSRDELKQFEMEQEFRTHKFIRYFIGDVRDAERLAQAFREVDFVVHAAAIKQVPAAECNPFECIKTNIHGAMNVINTAIACGVKKVLALSTDKAVNPINLYGATKLASDKLFVAGNNMNGGKTIFSVVRYGNVVGSRGSVIEFFQKCIAQGRKTLPITDPRMTRFWITLEQGVDFVIDNFARMHGGEIFVPKIKSMRITDVAKVIKPDAEFEIVGIRPGEKLHELMVPRDESRNTREFADYFVIQPSWWDSEKTGGRPAADGFEYSSDKNDAWMTPQELGAITARSHGKFAPDRIPIDSTH